MSQQKSRTVYARGAGRLAVAALLGGVLGFSDPAPALTDAACTGDVVRNVLMSEGRADFGRDPHLLGHPTNSGTICWSGGARVEGYLYRDELFDPGCAQIEVRFFNSLSPRQRLLRFTTNVCSPGGLRQKAVVATVRGSRTIQAQRVGRIEIELFVSDTPDGARARIGSTTHEF